MNRFVVDTNVIWSLAYRPNSSIGQFIMASDPQALTLYAPDYLRLELARHFDQIVSLSAQSQAEVAAVLDLAYGKLTFISDRQIPLSCYLTAAPLVRDIDMDDIVFVALAEYIQCPLWSGDKKLLLGLRSKGYANVVDFPQVKTLVSTSQ